MTYPRIWTTPRGMSIAMWAMVAWGVYNLIYSQAWYGWTSYFIDIQGEPYGGFYLITADWTMRVFLQSTAVLQIIVAYGMKTYVWWGYYGAMLTMLLSLLIYAGMTNLYFTTAALENLAGAGAVAVGFMVYLRRPAVKAYLTRF